MTQQPSFDLSTAVEPADYFSIDGELYELYALRRLNREQEVRLQWLFRRHIGLTQELNEKVSPETGERRAVQLATWLRDVEVEVIAMMTNVPLEVAETLGLEARATLFKHIGDQLKGLRMMAEETGGAEAG